MKKLSALLIVFLLVILSSCSSKPNDSDPLDVVSDSIRTEISSMTIVQEGHIKCDYTPSDAYVIDDISIIKRSLSDDDKKDTVYCKVDMHNTYYQTTFNAELVFNYYEVGGWICDNKHAYEQNSKPIAGVSKDHLNEITVSVKERKVTLSSDNIRKIDFDAERMSCMIYYEYRDDIMEFYGFDTISFEDGKWGKLNGDNYTTTGFSPSWDSGNYYPYETTFKYDGLLYEPGNAIYSPKYYPNEEWKAQDKTLTVDNPWLLCNIKIDEISVENGVVKGSFSLEDNKPGEWPNPKEKVTKEFETTINTKTGAFSIDAEVELFSYSYHGFVSIDDPCYTPAKIRIDAKYNFASNNWYFKVIIEKLLLD